MSSLLPQKRVWLVYAGLAVASLALVIAFKDKFAAPAAPGVRAPSELPEGSARATFGTGCFWCTEAVFQQLKGVRAVASGYSGGHLKNPTYHDVLSRTTGHAEVVQIAFDPAVISYDELLEVFWKSHDPTTLNSQGNDHGPQYRSAIFTHNDEQKQAAESSKRKLDAAGVFGGPIVTEIVPFTEFYRAEDYHQTFYQDNPNHAYCRFIIGPKLTKLRQVLRGSLKEPAGHD